MSMSMSMKLHESLTSSAIAIVLLLLINTNQASCQEVEDEREFSYERGSDIGPEHWGEIHREWAVCGTGRMQSPIDLASDRVRVVAGLGQLRRAYGPAKAAMKNRGHDIEIKWEEGAGGMWVNATYYGLRQAHWHSPSEHTINGSRYALELHLVHQTQDNKTAVVGIVYTIGRPDLFITRMEEFIKKASDMGEEEEEEVQLGIVDASVIGMGSSRNSEEYYRYLGSLTTPPCTEGVTWTIIKQARTISLEQIQLLREAVNNETNARPIQQTNNRMIALFKPAKFHF